jgi:O-antigen/teichoic acid export membrane protein
LLGITFLNQLKDLLRYENNFAYIIFFFISFISAIIVIPNSLNNSLGFFKLNNSINLSVDIFKLVLILLLSNLYQFDFNILINVHLALLIILYFVYLNFTKKYIYISRSQNIKIDLNHSEKTNLMYAILYSFFIPFFYFFDIILVRNLFSAEVSSNYIVASSISKIIFIFPQALNVVIFNESLKLSMFKVLSILIFFIIIILSIMTLLFFLGEYIIEVIYSSKFNEAYKFLKFLLPSFFLTSLSKILCDILISKKKFKFIFGLYLSFLLFIFLTYINSETALNISLNLLFANIFFFLIVSFYIYKDYFKILKNFFKVLKNYTKTI